MTLEKQTDLLEVASLCFASPIDLPSCDRYAHTRQIIIHRNTNAAPLRKKTPREKSVRFPHLVHLDLGDMESGNNDQTEIPTGHVHLDAGAGCSGGGGGTWGWKTVFERLPEDDVAFLCLRLAARRGGL